MGTKLVLFLLDVLISLRPASCTLPTLWHCSLMFSAVLLYWTCHVFWSYMSTYINLKYFLLHILFSLFESVFSAFSLWIESLRSWLHE